MVREREVQESVSHAIIQVHLTGDRQDDDGYINTVSVVDVASMDNLLWAPWRTGRV